MDDAQIGGQLRVGTGICPPIKEGDYKINGTAHVEGPMVVGNGLKIKLGASLQDPDEPTAVGVQNQDNPGAAPANFMVTRCYNDDRDCFTPAIKRALQTEGNVRINGDNGTPNALDLSGNYKQIGDMDITGDGKISGNWTIGGTMKSNYATWSGSIVATTKLFDIPHPNKEGYRLAHACLEGPEHSVYFRGKVKNKSIIQLPKYWENLVDPTTITVSLTPIGAHQNVIVKRIDDGKIHLQAQGGMPINCFFHVFATRQDVERLEVEYEGNSVDDSPNKP